MRKDINLVEFGEGESSFKAIMFDGTYYKISASKKSISISQDLPSTHDFIGTCYGNQIYKYLSIDELEAVIRKIVNEMPVVQFDESVFVKVDNRMFDVGKIEESTETVTLESSTEIIN